MKLILKILLVSSIVVIGVCTPVIGQHTMILQSNAFKLNIQNPECHGELGQLNLMSLDSQHVVLEYSFDNLHFQDFSGQIDLPIGHHQLFVKSDSEEDFFEFSIMPNEEISFDFINITPSSCNGALGRVHAAITGSGSASFPNTGSGTVNFPSTGSGTILVNSTSFGPEINIELEPGSYILTAFLNDEIRLDSTIIIPQEFCNVYIPNAIYTESSQGLNRRFVLGFETNNSPIINEYSIYDRWGSLIYQRVNIDALQFNEWWDGTCNGEECLSGVYSYRIQYQFDNGSPIDKTGTVMLF